MIFRYLNLGRSLDRNITMVKYWGNCDLKRIDAVDGRIFGCTKFGDSTMWDSEKYLHLIESGIIAREHLSFGEVRPEEVGCALSHKKAVTDFLQSSERECGILEDDTMPLCDLFKFEMPAGSDFYCLLGDDHPGIRVKTWEDGTLRVLRNLSAYVITRRGAECMLEAMDEIWGPVDIQVGFRAIRSINPRRQNYAFDRIDPDMIGMAPKVSMVGLSDSCLETTMGYGSKANLDVCESSQPYFSK